MKNKEFKKNDKKKRKSSTSSNNVYRYRQKPQLATKEIKKEREREKANGII